MKNSIASFASSFFLLPFLFFLNEAALSAESLLKESNFENGYEVISPFRDIYTERPEVEAIHQLKNSRHKPAWRLVQWGSAKSIAHVTPLYVHDDGKPDEGNLDGGKSWSVVEKKDDQDILYKSVGLNTTTVTLELNGLAEFNQHYLTSSDEYWPHLLMVQNIKTAKLSKYKELNFSLDAHLLFDEKNIRDGYQQNLHAGRYIISMAVRNTLSGNSFWLNLVIYDDRFEQTDFGCQKCRDKARSDCYTPKHLIDEGSWLCPFDGERWSKTSEKKGTRRMLFRLPTSAITTGNIQKGEWVHYAVDLIPYIKAGIEAAQDEEKLRGFSSSLMFYNLTLFTMGWEITGLNHAAMEVKNLSLIGK